jgi:hypothetical protein
MRSPLPPQQIQQYPAADMIQRVKGINEGTYVEVKDDGIPWYGVVVKDNGDSYEIRIGGTGQEVTVDQASVDFHPTHSSLNKRSVEDFLYEGDGRVKKGMSPKDEREKLKAPKNPGQKNAVGKYVYHSTSYKNLPSIQENGLDPEKGGGSGGSCELCEEGELKETSIRNSKNKIAVAVDRLTMGTYINQREEYASKPEQDDSAGNFSVLLRFKVQERHQGFKNKAETISSTWSKDPDDTRAWHLTGIAVLPSELEFLTTEGWYPLLALSNMVQVLNEQRMASQ